MPRSGVPPSASDARFLPGRILGQNLISLGVHKCTRACVSRTPNAPRLGTSDFPQADVSRSPLSFHPARHAELPPGAFRILGEERPPSSAVPGAFLSWGVSQSHFFTRTAPPREGRRWQRERTGGADETPALPLICWENEDKLFNFSEPQCPCV